MPAIDGEEKKIETEPLKILGKWTNNQFQDASIRISAMTHRVNVRDGHLEAVSVKLRQTATAAQVEDAMGTFSSPIDELSLPSAPRPVMILDLTLSVRSRVWTGIGAGAWPLSLAR